MRDGLPLADAASGFVYESRRRPPAPDSIASSRFCPAVNWSEKLNRAALTAYAIGPSGKSIFSIALVLST
jgi:hypothetical protein